MMFAGNQHRQARLLLDRDTEGPQEQEGEASALAEQVHYDEPTDAELDY